MMLGENDLPGFTLDVQHEVSRRLNLPSEDWMQDWPIEVTDAKRLEEFVTGYSFETQAEHRSAIATLIISCLNDHLALEGPVSEGLLHQIADLLESHPELLGYWASWDAETPEEMFPVSPWIRSFISRQA